MKNIDNEVRGFRGGSWNYDAGDCRASLRYGNPPGYRYDDLGFRVVHRRKK